MRVWIRPGGGGGGRGRCLVIGRGKQGMGIDMLSCYDIMKT